MENLKEMSPIFTEKELKDAVTCISTIISTSVRQNDFDPSNWEDYLQHWVEKTGQTAEVHQHITETVIRSLNYIQGNE